MVPKFDSTAGGNVQSALPQGTSHSATACDSANFDTKPHTHPRESSHSHKEESSCKRPSAIAVCCHFSQPMVQKKTILVSLFPCPFQASHRSMWPAGPSRRDKGSKKKHNPRQSRNRCRNRYAKAPNLCMEKNRKSQSPCKILYSGWVVQRGDELARLNAR